MASPENALAQSIRCYTPVDLNLLLEGTGLYLDHIEIEGQAVEIADFRILLSKELFKIDYNYLAQIWSSNLFED